MKNALALLASLVFLQACDVNIATKANHEKLDGAGITFIVPVETSSSTHGSHGITYDGDSVTAETDGKTLTFGGVDYGPLNAGDIVDLSRRDAVRVNGTPRTPPSP